MKVSALFRLIEVTAGRTHALTTATLALPGVERVEIHCDEANVRGQAAVRLGYRFAPYRGRRHWCIHLQRAKQDLALPPAPGSPDGGLRDERTERPGVGSDQQVLL
jgi:hypothetical protein